MQNVIPAADFSWESPRTGQGAQTQTPVFSFTQLAASPHHPQTPEPPPFPTFPLLSSQSPLTNLRFQAVPPQPPSRSLYTPQQGQLSHVGSSDSSSAVGSSWCWEQPELCGYATGKEQAGYPLQLRLPRAPSSLSLSTCRAGAPTLAGHPVLVDILTAPSVKNFFLTEMPTLQQAASVIILLCTHLAAAPQHCFGS